MNINDEDEEDDEDELNGLFTFNVYQRIANSPAEEASSCDVLLPSITDTPTQQMLRSNGSVFPRIMEVVADSQNDDKARATATLLLRACMTSHPSARQMLQLGDGTG